VTRQGIRAALQDFERRPLHVDPEGRAVGCDPCTRVLPRSVEWNHLDGDFRDLVEFPAFADRPPDLKVFDIGCVEGDVAGRGADGLGAVDDGAVGVFGPETVADLWVGLEGDRFSVSGLGDMKCRDVSAMWAPISNSSVASIQSTMPWNSCTSASARAVAFAVASASFRVLCGSVPSSSASCFQ
jgi:hypothetical protein